MTSLAPEPAAVDEQLQYDLATQAASRSVMYDLVTRLMTEPEDADVMQDLSVYLAHRARIARNPADARHATDEAQAVPPAAARVSEPGTLRTVSAVSAVSAVVGLVGERP